MAEPALLEPPPRELAELVRAARRHLRAGLAIVLGSLGLAALLSLLPGSYVADATLAYEPQAGLSRGGGAAAMTDAQRDSEIDAQLALVASLPVARDVARSVDLAANPRLRQEAAERAADSDRPLGPQEALGAALLDHVKARRVGQTPMFTIGFTARSAQQAALIANGFAASYLAAALRQKAALADAGGRGIAGRVAQLRRQASAADADLAAFRLANNLLDTPDSTALEQEVATLRGQLADARGQAALAGTRSSAADATTVVGGGYGGSVDTTPVSALTGQRAATAADLSALLARYGDRHPDVIAARERLAQLDAQLAEAMHGNRSSAATEAVAAGARARALSGSLRDSEARLAATLSHDARLRDLQNSALAVRQAYQDALRLSADQIAARALVEPDAQIVAAAVPPLRPRFPRLGIDLLAGLGLGLAAAAAIAVLRECWFHTLATPDDIVHWLDADHFAPLPKLAPLAGTALLRGWPLRRAGARDPIEAVLADPGSAFADSFRELGAAALFAASGGGGAGLRGGDGGGPGRVIGICSALPGEGKATTAIAMGTALVADGMTVALLDGAAGGRIAAILSGFAGRRAAGLAVFPGDAAPGAAPGPAAGGALPVSSGASSTPIAVLRRDYDVTIIVMEPVLAGGGRRRLLGEIDALVLLARWRSTPVRAVREAMRRIAAAGGTVSGIALSMVEQA